jgi:predicted XRE-type DNA-binding protein
MSEEIEFEMGSGNVFADLGRPGAEEMLVKAELVHQISRIVRHRRLTQVQAAEILGISQPKVSELLRGNLRGFSLERIARFLTALGRDVEIRVRPKPRSRSAGRMSVING